MFVKLCDCKRHVFFLLSFIEMVCLLNYVLLNVKCMSAGFKYQNYVLELLLLLILFVI